MRAFNDIRRLALDAAAFLLALGFTLGAHAQQTPQAIPLSSGACKLDGTVGCGSGGGGGSGDITAVNITASAPLTGTASCSTGACSFTLGLSATPNIGAATATSINGTTIPTSDTLVTPTASQTLTNKRINPRTGTTTSSATPSINTDNVEFYSITALAVDITDFTMTGTPVDGQRLVIAITGTGTRAITWGSSFESSSATLPTSIGTSRLDVGFVWNSVTSKWRCVAKV